MQRNPQNTPKLAQNESHAIQTFHAQQLELLHIYFSSNQILCLLEL